jgi:4-amino-4-deoxy-L-arabinose transferase-like glycosyltransferase
VLNNYLISSLSTFKKSLLHQDSSLSPNQLMALFILGFALIYILIPSFLYQSILPDSAQNLSWGHTWSWSYNRHPPLGTWLLSLMSIISANNEVATFSASALCLSVSLCFIFLIAKRYLSVQDAFVACVLSSFSLYYLTNFVLQFNQNTIMLPFWIMIGYFTDRCLQANKTKDWIFLGIVTAGALLAKYESSLIVFIALVYLLRHFEYKFLFKFILALAVTLLLLTPHLISVAQHGFLTLEFIHGRVNEGQNHTAFYTHLFYPLKALVEQLGHLLPAMLVMGFLVFNKKIIKSSDDLKRPKNNYLIYLGIAPLCLVILLSFMFGLKIQAEWGFPLFSFTLPALMSFFQLKSKAALLKPLLFIALTIHTATILTYTSVNYFSPKFTRTNNPSYELAKNAQNYWNQFTTEPLRYVAGDENYDYYLAAYLPTKPLLLEAFSVDLSPWVNKTDLKKSGLMIITEGCDNNRLETLKTQYSAKSYQCINLQLSNKYREQFKSFALLVVPPNRTKG